MFSGVFASVSTVSDMLHVFYLDVIKVDRNIAHVVSRRGKWTQAEAVRWL